MKEIEKLTLDDILRYVLCGAIALLLFIILHWEEICPLLKDFDFNDIEFTVVSILVISSLIIGSMINAFNKAIALRMFDLLIRKIGLKKENRMKDKIWGVDVTLDSSSGIARYVFLKDTELKPCFSRSKKTMTDIYFLYSTAYAIIIVLALTNRDAPYWLVSLMIGASSFALALISHFRLVRFEARVSEIPHKIDSVEPTSGKESSKKG